MNGPEHYAEAVRLMAEAEADGWTTSRATAYREAAQVHATLALAAATVNGRASAALDHHDEWATVLGTTETG